MAASHSRDGSGYWRSLEELQASPDFQQYLDTEFPGGVEPPAGLSRRRFLQVMSASFALATLAGCRWPEEKIVPFVKRPEGMIPGVPVQFATAFELGPVAWPVVATSYDGRPIKIDGHPHHTLSRGSASALAQASVLDLYDPDRSKSVLQRKGARLVKADWQQFLVFCRRQFGADLSGVAVLTGSTSSPSVRELLGGFGRRGGQIYLWEPLCRRNEVVGAAQTFGSPMRAGLDLTAARVVVDFEADLLHDHPQALKNSRDFVAGRRADAEQPCRLYVYEHTFSVTGSTADHRYRTAAQDIPAAAWALAAELVLGEGLPLPANSGLDRTELARWRGHPAGGSEIAALAADLMANRGYGLLLAGSRQPPAVQVLLNVLNVALDNAGRTVTYLPVQPPEALTITELARDLKLGQIRTLITLGANPVYTAPADLNFEQALAEVSTHIHLGMGLDETSTGCTWHLPQAHYLEGWGDATAWDGSTLAIQPLITPLHGGKTAAEVISAILEETPRSGHEIARATFGRKIGSRPTGPGFAKRWQEYLHCGSLAPGESPGARSLVGAAQVAPAEPAELSSDNLELNFLPAAALYDGRFADNAWLQEMPDPVTKLAWDNAALISPKAAAELHIAHGDVVELAYRGRMLELPAYVMPGQADYSVTVHLGYGRNRAGRVGKDVGANAYKLRTGKALAGGPGLALRRTGKTYPLACTQDHHAIDTRGAAEMQKRVPGLVREGTFADYHAHPEFVDHLGIHHPQLESLWTEHEYTGHAWGLAIDLNACTGCGACQIACQAENNIPVVGKDEVGRGREMSWLRLDRYFLGDPQDPKCVQQPVGCMQCELAPCEQVCPVAATMHTDEGLNTMVYNRCIGTRYCSNNCPYKVRRFNWFNNFEDLTETQRLVLNPEVTVRARGVMEKCTYCVQRIEQARVQARIEGREIMDGDITPACAQTCPTEAIVFGDLNDPESRVSKLRRDKRAYDLLGYLNVKPRTFYLARLRNPNPKHDSHVEG